MYQQKTESPQTWKKNSIHARQQKWTQKPLHGQYPRQIEEVTNQETRYRWLKHVNLKIETEALITAAQDQAINTKAHKTYIMKTNNDPKCRLCKENDETTAHLLTGCQKLAASEYLRRHNEVAKIIHRPICNEYGIPVEDQYWKHMPLAVTETDQVKILWDMEIRTDHHIQCRRPDIVITDKIKKKTMIIDIAIPDDRNIQMKEQEKISKYQDLRLEVQKL